MTDHLALLTYLPFVGGVLLLAAFLILYLALRHAADGSEDETGFHHHLEPTNPPEAALTDERYSRKWRTTRGSAR